MRLQIHGVVQDPDDNEPAVDFPEHNEMTDPGDPLAGAGPQAAVTEVVQTQILPQFEAAVNA